MKLWFLGTMNSFRITWLFKIEFHSDNSVITTLWTMLLKIFLDSKKPQNIITASSKSSKWYNQTGNK